MLKRTLLLSNPFYLSVKNNQLIMSQKDGDDKFSSPIEDIGFIILDHNQISFSMGLIESLIQNNAAVIFCDKKHYPTSMLLNLDGNHIQNEVFTSQVNASIPLKKNLWKQTIEAKIKNQAFLLIKLNLDPGLLSGMQKKVKSGDSDNREAVAARYYWKQLFGNDFIRERYGEPPNNMLNYGYAVLRAAVARALIGSGLLSTLGIHHHNRYNAYCLADDIMEPYRPFVDEIVFELNQLYPDLFILEKEIKAELLQILTVDVYYQKVKRPLMIGLSQTTSSLARCYNGEIKNINYPVIK